MRRPQNMSSSVTPCIIGGDGGFGLRSWGHNRSTSFFWDPWGKKTAPLNLTQGRFPNAAFKKMLKSTIHRDIFISKMRTLGHLCISVKSQLHSHIWILRQVHYPRCLADSAASFCPFPGATFSDLTQKKATVKSVNHGVRQRYDKHQET